MEIRFRLRQRDLRIFAELARIRDLSIHNYAAELAERDVAEYRLHKIQEQTPPLPEFGARPDFRISRHVRDRIRVLYEEDLPISQIADRCGCSASSVHRILAEAKASE